MTISIFSRNATAALAAGALLFSPAANAALDESSMSFTSAAEGFYGSLRVGYENNDVKTKDNDSTVGADSSRLGVRGSADLGNGVAALYQFEWDLGDPSNGAKGDKGLNTRQHNVGLRGKFGTILLGAFDSVIVRLNGGAGGFAMTDILPRYSGNFEPAYRTKNAIGYITPEVGGLQIGFEGWVNDGGKDRVKANDDGITTKTDKLTIGNGGNATRIQSDDDDNEFDAFGLGLNYTNGGFSIGGAYFIQFDELRIGRGIETDSEQAGLDTYEDSEHKEQYVGGISYSADNWILAGMYGIEKYDPERCIAVAQAECTARIRQEDDAAFYSIVGGVSFDKLDVHALWERKLYKERHIEDPATDRNSGYNSQDEELTIIAFTARYNLGSKAQLYAGWKQTQEEKTDFSEDATLSSTERENESYSVALRVDF